VGTSEVLVEMDVGGLDRQLAPLGHGIAGVYGKVHDDLVDLAGIRAQSPETGTGNHDQIDILPIMRVSILRFSATTSFRSRTLGRASAYG